jgi:hypothetical protein
MGDRGNIEMVYYNGDKIYFYTHWTGSDLPLILKSALIRGKNRWNDESYLSRIIFSEMIKYNVLEEVGYGISPYITDNEHDIISVNCSLQTITIENKGVWTFPEFVELALSDVPV